MTGWPAGRNCGQVGIPLPDRRNCSTVSAHFGQRARRDAVALESDATTHSLSDIKYADDAVQPPHHLSIALQLKQREGTGLRFVGC